MISGAEPEGSAERVRTDDVWDLGPFTLRLRSNVADFPGRHLFWQRARDDSAARYQVDAWDINAGDIDAEDIGAGDIDAGGIDAGGIGAGGIGASGPAGRPAQAGRHAPGLGSAEFDPTITARRLMSGYYQGHHFGPPVALRSRGDTTILRGSRLEGVLWTYLVKNLLTRFALETGCVHLKTGGIRLDDGAVVVAGRAEGGKTVFLTEACRAGATYVTNTHGLLDRDGCLQGVATSIRVRKDGALHAGVATRPHPLTDDLNVAPTALFERVDLTPAPVKAVLIADYRPAGRIGLRPISADLAEEFLTNFALATVVYGQRNDLLAMSGGEVEALAEASLAMRRSIRGLCQDVPCFVANLDLRQPDEAAKVLARLRAA